MSINQLTCLMAVTPITNSIGIKLADGLVGGSGTKYLLIKNKKFFKQMLFRSKIFM